MIWWKPTARAAYGFWFNSPKLMLTDMSRLAAKEIYSVFNLFPVLADPANDRDSIKW